MSKVRRKRASPDELYRHCLGGGDCIPDVKNKYEQNTWADVLLKIFGSLVYFGNLGIGTGKGSGGSLGYRPLDSVGPGRPTTITPARPTVTIDAIGPKDIIPIDADAPSIVPFSEGTVDTSITATDAGPGLGAEEIELYTVTTPTEPVGGTDVTPTVVSSEEGAVAIIDAQPIPDRPVQVYFDPSSTALHELTVFSTPQTNVTDVSVYADPSYSGTIIGGYEEIPLDRLDFAEFEIEETPTTSTPTQKIEKVINRAKSFYNRYTKQVPIRDPKFLSQPSSLVQFEFDNPAFEADISIEFERDLAQVAAAPNEEFRDIIRLGREQLSAVDKTVRVSRIGETGAMTTRSGTVIGQRVHFFYDISEINAPETIELAVLQDSTLNRTVVDDLVESTVIDSINNPNVAYTEEDLEDIYEETFNNGHLSVITDKKQESFLVPTFEANTTVQPIIVDIDTNTIISPSITPDVVNINLLPLNPSITFQMPYDYYLDPAFYPPKKRRRLELF
uniref:Minor capsid protein L2 n=1 Tax=Human papillomavirus TaxID=10566 RepID=A0A385PLV6_9PAPI|nr:MAG: L2 protein [Human papillomavirus]